MHYARGRGFIYILLHFIQQVRKTTSSDSTAPFGTFTAATPSSAIVAPRRHAETWAPTFRENDSHHGEALASNQTPTA